MQEVNDPLSLVKQREVRKGLRTVGRWQIDTFRQNGGLLLLVLAGLWAAGLTSLGRVRAGPATGQADTSRSSKALSAKAGRRITTVTIETSDPVAYLTNRPDPMTLLVDLREVDATRAAQTSSRPKASIAGGSVEQATGADGVRIARVRIRLTQPASHQVRSKRNVIYVDLDSAFPLGSVGGRDPRRRARARRNRVSPRSLESVRADGEAERRQRHADRQRRARRRSR